MGLRDTSRKEFNLDNFVKPTENEIKIGCLQRIADSFEKMAVPFAQSVWTIEDQKKRIEELQARNRSLNLSNIAYRAWITRLKNKLHNA